MSAAGYHYDRAGDRVEDTDGRPLATVTVMPFATATGHRCRKGFLGEDEQGRVILCPVCRPASAQRVREQRARWGA